VTTSELGQPTLTTRTDLAASARRAPALLWLACGAVMFFLVPWIGTDWLGLQPDLYYLGYFTVAVTFFAAFVSTHAAALRPLWTLNLWQSLLIGAAAGGVLAVGIFQQASTPHAGDWRFPFEIAWRGVVYGTVDAITLFVFPAAVAYLLMRGNRQGLKRKAGFAALALVLSMFVTATYHLGYSEYRDSSLRYPEIGAVVANVPTALTGNPVGAVVTHSTMHVSAVVHQRDGGQQQMLPPNVTTDYPNHGSGDLAAGIALFWMLAAAGSLTLMVRRQRRPGPTD